MPMMIITTSSSMSVKPRSSYSRRRIAEIMLRMAAIGRVEIEHPVVQAGMGGGLARHELAGAVSGAGGLGTIGILPADGLRQSIAAARERAEGRPIAVTLLLPFVRRSPLEVAGEADVVVTFWGRPRRPA